MDKIVNLCRKYDLRLVEDCAQSHGAAAGGKVTGTFGDIGCFSFYPSKNLGAFGDAGAIVTDNEEYARAMRMYRNYGSEKRYYNKVVGANSRLDELQAAMLSVRLACCPGGCDPCVASVCDPHGLPAGTDRLSGGERDRYYHTLSCAASPFGGVWLSWLSEGRPGDNGEICGYGVIASHVQWDDPGGTDAGHSMPERILRKDIASSGSSADAQGYAGAGAADGNGTGEK